MNEGFKIRIVIGIRKALLDKINRDIKSRPDTQEQRLIKCIEKGYQLLVCKATTPREGQAEQSV